MGLLYIHFNPILVRFKLTVSLIDDTTMKNFNPILVRFKQALQIVYQELYSYFNPILVRFKLPIPDAPGVTGEIISILF